MLFATGRDYGYGIVRVVVEAAVRAAVGVRLRLGLGLQLQLRLQLQLLLRLMDTWLQKVTRLWFFVVSHRILLSPSLCQLRSTVATIAHLVLTIG